MFEGGVGGQSWDVYLFVQGRLLHNWSQMFLDTVTHKNVRGFGYRDKKRKETRLLCGATGKFVWDRRGGVNTSVDLPLRGPRSTCTSE